MVHQIIALATVVVVREILGEDARGSTGAAVAAVGDGPAVGCTVPLLLLGFLASQVSLQAVLDGLSLPTFFG